jgi:hypothetical protein
MLMKVKTEAIDFCLIDLKHEVIHKRLENWASWCKGGSPNPSASPMFRLYRPDNFERPAVADQVDGTDAQRIAKAMHRLPLKHRVSLNWFYVKPIGPLKMCKQLGLSMEGLAEHVTDGRQMLINIRA